MSAREIVARAPTRIDFGGGWTDVPPYPIEQGGCVCNVAIARRATVRLAAGAAGDAGTGASGGSGGSAGSGADDALVRAALSSARLHTLAGRVSSDFPARAGLGGSSAVGVALQAAIAAWREERVPREELAERSRAVEVDVLGIAGGRQDHYASALGGTLGLWFEDRVRVRRIDLAPGTVRALERRSVVAYTGESRVSAAMITAVLDAYRDGVPRVRAALARMKTLAEEMIAALERANVDELALLVAEHWEQQRSLHAGIATPLIDAVIARARGAGATGWKALGASAGGCVLAIAPEERADAVRQAVADIARPLPFALDLCGVRVEGEPE